MPRGTTGEENGFESARGGESGHGEKSKECRGGEGAAAAAAAAPEQWLGKLSRLCVNQPGLRRTAGKENSVGRARGGEPGRGTESKE